MKKLLLSIALGGLTASGFAQGTVSFQNFSNAGGGLVYSNATPTLTGAALASGSITLELLYGPVGSTLAQLVAGGAGFGDTVFTYNVSTAAKGKFIDGSTVTTTGAAGGGSGDATLNVELAIAGWTGGAANYQAALTSAPLIGITGAWGNATGGGGSPPATQAGLVQWVNANSLVLAPTPEPATLALGGLGAAALLLFRRRK